MHSGPRPSAGLLLEILTPWCFGVTGLVTGYFWTALWLLKSDWAPGFLGNVIAACSIFVAYLLTAATILPAVEEKVIMKRLRNWGYYQHILDYIGRAAWSSGALLLISLMIFPIPQGLRVVAGVDRAVSAIWWAVFAFMVGAVFIATRILLKMLRAQ